jgi:hypothetical protein
VGRLEDRLDRHREEVEGLEKIAPSPDELSEEELVRMMPVVDSLLKGEPVPDELLTPEVKRVAKELEPYAEAIEEMEREGFFGPWPDETYEPSEGES